MLEPILEARVGLRPMLHGVIPQQELPEPRIGFLFGLWAHGNDIGFRAFP